MREKKKYDRENVEREILCVRGCGGMRKKEGIRERVRVEYVCLRGRRRVSVSEIGVQRERERGVMGA